jgi:hypothetical protein
MADKDVCVTVVLKHVFNGPACLVPIKQRAYDDLLEHRHLVDRQIEERGWAARSCTKIKALTWKREIQDL